MKVLLKNQPLWFLSPTNHHYKLELFLELAYVFIPVGLLFLPQNPALCILPAVLCLIEIPLWMFYVIPHFSCTYLFFCQDCKLLKTQHCTHLPFVNDLDLLRKKKKV